MFEVSERMAKISDPDLQARLLREAIGSSEKKRKLEEDIRIADVRSKFDSAARKDRTVEIAYFARMTAIT